ncbi:MAG: sigma-70 family RNA polymerase sigma factor [Eubacteriaceae bacterium]|nr:sigma-70 family RNA polymerase sigma factor [Eubacteriaceae bacterium]
MRYEKKISKKDSTDLFLEYKKTQDRDLRDYLIENYLYIPKLLSQKYGYKNGEYEDIFQVACLGLLLAVDRFDPTRGYEFGTFATPTIVGEIKKYHRDKEQLIRIPRKIQELNHQINQARELLENRLMHSPTISEIAVYLEITEENIIRAMESNNVYYPKSLSMDYENNSTGKAVNFMDFLGTMDINMQNVENVDTLRTSIKKLNALERMIIKERFLKEKTQKEVAMLIGKSQMTVSRIEKKVMKKLKEEFLLTTF